MQFNLNFDFSDSSCILFSDRLSTFIFFPELNFLTISYIMREFVVVLPSFSISTLLIRWTKIISRSVAVIISSFPLASKRTLDKIGSVLLLSITF